MLSHRIEPQWIAMEGIMVKENFHCLLINIYNSCESSIRSETWCAVEDFCKNSPLPLLIAGDFNEVLSSQDRGSRIIDEVSSGKFREFISSLHLTEITPSNGFFTWFRGQSKSKLDRILVQPEWILKFPSLNSSILKRSISDHCPLFLQAHLIDWGPKPFKFLDIWLTHNDCLTITRKVWENLKGCPIPEKLRAVRMELKSWNHSTFGNIDSKITHLEDEIHKWDIMANERNLSEAELGIRSQVQLHLWEWIKRKEIHWAQQSRINWLKSGDKNSKFFHAYASIRRRKNNINSIMIDGKEVRDPEEIKKEASSYFKNLFTEENHTRPTFLNLNFKKLSPSQSSDLTKPFSHSEIEKAVASCNPSKSPGPDGFNFNFIKSSWEIIKEDIFSMINDFWQTGNLPKGSNVAFIALIAKIEAPVNFKDFRPISMVESLYKIIAKLLADRLKRVMGDLIGPHQSSFIEGRQILDSILITGELLDSCKRSKAGAVMLKLDFIRHLIACHGPSWIGLWTK